MEFLRSKSDLALVCVARLISVVTHLLIMWKFYFRIFHRRAKPINSILANGDNSPTVDSYEKFVVGYIHGSDSEMAFMK